VATTTPVAGESPKGEPAPSERGLGAGAVASPTAGGAPTVRWVSERTDEYEYCEKRIDEFGNLHDRLIKDPRAESRIVIEEHTAREHHYTYVLGDKIVWYGTLSTTESYCREKPLKDSLHELLRELELVLQGSNLNLAVSVDRVEISTKGKRVIFRWC